MFGFFVGVGMIVAGLAYAPFAAEYQARLAQERFNRTVLKRRGPKNYEWVDPSPSPYGKTKPLSARNKEHTPKNQNASSPSPTNTKEPSTKHQPKIQPQDPRDPTKGRCDGTAVRVDVYDFKDIVTSYYTIEEDDTV